METITTKPKSKNELHKYKDEFFNSFKSKASTLETQLNPMKTFADKVSTELEGSNPRQAYSTFQNLYKQVLSSYIESTCLGYDALFSVMGLNMESKILAPELRNELLIDLRKANLLEKLQTEFVQDMLDYGECVAQVTLSEKVEKINSKLEISDELGLDEDVQLKVEIISSEDVYSIERISPEDFLVDAYDFRDNPTSCAKIKRSYIDPSNLKSSSEYELLDSDKIEDISKNNSTTRTTLWNWLSEQTQTTKNQIKKLEYFGDWTASDGTVFENIHGVMIEGYPALLEFSILSECRFIYSPYRISRTTHRGYSPLINTLKVGTITSKVINLNLKNLTELLNPIRLFKKGSIDFKTNRANNDFEQTRQLEISSSAIAEDYPQYLKPPVTGITGMEFAETLGQATRNSLALTDYNTGTMGAVRTASEAVLLSNASNRRTAVEVVPLSNFIKQTVTAFYAIKRNAALTSGVENIYTNPALNVFIDNLETQTNNYNDYSKLMQILSIPAVATQLLANTNEKQKMLITKYIASKAGITDMGELMNELEKHSDNSEVPQLMDMPSIPQQGGLPNELDNILQLNGG